MSRTSVANSAVSPPGVILLQIDGLSMVQLQRALGNGKMPFLQTLIETQGYRLESFYSGLPSTTPAVQAELFFGISGAVPSIRYRGRDTGKDCLLLNPVRVKELVEDLAKGQTGLLQDGASYSNIYTGGASSARYCIERFEPRDLINHMQPLQTLWILLQHLGKILRIIGLALVESGLALVDMCRGIWQKRRIFKELKFVPTRIWVCVVLRELVRFWCKRDIRLGVPILCANFVGYDEHAHRRGPDSAFAHWALTGIDGVLRDIHTKARQSKKRDYLVLIYSDHGQEAVTSYRSATGRSLSEGLREVFSEGPLANKEIAWTEELLGQPYFYRRGRKFMNSLHEWGFGESDGGQAIRVTALGPLGHIYLPKKLEADRLAQYAHRLVETAKIPLVFYRLPDDGVQAVNQQGRYPLHQQNPDILGGDHPFPDQVWRDLVRLVDHKDSGDFIISGWDPTGQSLTFPQENGAHGGPGRQECHGFLLLPKDTAGPASGTWRPSGLRQFTMRHLGRNGDTLG